jgi:hypothetical protein
VLDHVGGGLAPWNVANHALDDRDGAVLVDGRRLVFFHYHSLKLYSGITQVRRAGLLARRYRFVDGPRPLVWTADYPVGPRELELVWEPYLRELGRAVDDVARHGGDPTAGFTAVDRTALFRAGVRSAARRVLT